MNGFIEWFFIKKVKMYTPVLWLWITFACIIAFNADKIPLICNNFFEATFVYVTITLILLKLERSKNDVNKLMVLDDLGAAYPARNWIKK